MACRKVVRSGILATIIVLSLIGSGCTSLPEPSGPNVTRAALRLESPAFPPDGSIPVIYTCDGQGQSPPLAWSMVPERTESFAIVFEDPDAPGGTYAHWVVYNIPPETRDLPAGITAGSQLPGGAEQGTGSNGENGYTGPCPFPPGSTHHYVLTLFALDSPLDLSGPVDDTELRDAMEGHILGTGQLAASYQRT